MVLTSRPRESASELFLDELLGLFRYPPGSGRALLAGTLSLRYCAARFACRTPLGGCRFLVMLLLVLVMGRGLFLMLDVGRFLEFVILVWDGKEFDSTENPLHTLRV